MTAGGEVRPRNPDDTCTSMRDHSETEHDFDWTVHTRLEAGVAKAIEYYRQFGIEQTFTHLKPVESAG